MGELTPGSSGEIVREDDIEPKLDLERILTHLLRIAEREGIDTDEEDLRLILGEDENDVLGNLASWAYQNGIEDHEDLFIELGVPAELIIQSPDQL